MSPPSAESSPNASACIVAAEWVMRHDRGLTAKEQDEFSLWLAADPCHRAAWAEHRWGWEELDRLAGLQTSLHAVPDPDLLKPGKAPSRRFPVSPAFTLAVAAAAVFAVTLFWWNGPAGASRVPPPAVPARALTLIEQRELADGSVVKLNRGAFLSERFSLTERRVRLDRGEAHFMVEPDPGRPFVVEAAGVAVRAVGTAFNVRIDSAAVEVVVTEGKVAVGTDDGGRTTEDGRPAFALQPPTSELRPPPDGVWPLSSGTLISAGERTVVSLVPNAPAPEVTTLSSAEIEARLAWQPRLLDFTNAPLPEIVAEFNRGNPVRLTLGDASLHALRLSATFRSDNVEGFVRLMVSDFGMRAERRGEAEILLSRVK